MPLQAVVNVAGLFVSWSLGPLIRFSVLRQNKTERERKILLLASNSSIYFPIHKKSFWLFVDICEMDIFLKDYFLFLFLIFFFFCSKTKWSKIFPSISFICYKFRVDLGAIVACFIMHDVLRKLFSVVMKDTEIFFY